jgi:hypothetical protein
MLSDRESVFQIGPLKKVRVRHFWRERTETVFGFRPCAPDQGVAHVTLSPALPVIPFAPSMKAPEAYVNWVNAHLGFNPRSQANSDALADFVVADLMATCPALSSSLKAGGLKPLKNANVRTKVAERSIDLVIHEETETPNISVRVSVENKTIMTAHGKARKNRYGDLIAYSNHMHNHNRKCVAGAIVIVNVSPAYENPDAFAKGLLRPKFKIDKLVADTIAIFGKIPQRDTVDDPNELPEAVAVIVVDYDGVNLAKLVSGPLAPQIESNLDYESFIRRMCDIYGKRFSGG